ncbi:diacylglycerol kinase [Rhodoblastus sp.]|uniref:diacylglycerol kinase n=1 Tax=Rhodoblastus sp. TaxID=1962975 RepID=UPI003F948EB3
MPTSGQFERKTLHPREMTSDLSKPHIVRAFCASLAGLASAMKTEAAFRTEVAVLAVAVPASLLLTDDFFRRAELVASLLAVLAIELLNTSVEKLCDHTTPGIDPAIKIVKDLGSAAVFCSLLMAGTLWIGAAVARFG